ncbi:putative baseplate assembly protein [Ralstonia phage phiRSP]|uniref:Putative baseplate assembly protein n=1 Tax=Ralstonia phage phiRSP TaxID=2201420 RepID=A0A345ANT2_9CAUD|nr:baseplate assembly protein [Ralstonia phage phiRSP]AXF38221.1 putative baseplate assembly protein [Ralstonia phage phiRSP]
MSRYALSEVERIQANLVRYGVVTELDAANARVKCSTGGLDTDWLPWCAGRAGATSKWSAPRPGEQVVVISPYGDPAQAFVLPGFYQDDHPAPANSQDKETTVYPDGSTVEYDSASNTLTVNVAGSGNVVVNCKVATVKAATSVTLDTPMVHATKDMQIDGNLGVTGAMAVQGQGASGAVSTFAGSIKVNSGDVMADNISLKGHHHTAQGSDAPTTPAEP